MPQTTKTQAGLVHLKPKGVGTKRILALVPLRSPEARRQQEEAQQMAVQQKLFLETQLRVAAASERAPVGYDRPTFNSPQYWRDCAKGWVKWTPIIGPPAGQV